MDLYVPDGVGASPAVVVSLHYCGGNAGNAHSWFQSYADTNKFLIIAPKSAGSCFDAGLGRTGERANIVKMVEYVVAQNGANPKKVFAAGPSSGACMTQALLASYPDVFAGGSSLAGVPAGAWTGGGAYGWSAPASTTAQQWGDKVRNAFPGFTGSRPRVQFWQGMGDTNLTYSQTYPAQVAQWTNVFAVTDANATKASIKPPGAVNTWARSSYTDCTGLVVVEANSGPSNVVHDLTPEGLWQDAVRFFGLTQGGTPVGSCSGTSGTGGAGGAGGGAGGASGSGGRGGAGGSGGANGGAGASGSGGRGGAGGSGGASGGAGIAGTTGAGGVQGTGGRGGTSAGGAGGSGNAGSTGGGGAGTTGSAGTGGNPGTGGSNTTAGSGGTTGSGASGGSVGAGSGGSATTGLGGMPGTGSGGSQMEVDGPAGCACNVDAGSRAGHSRFSLATLLVAVVGLVLRSRKRARR
jgi:poly(hydroxyalkanoate) depolymerase family esterase